MRKRLAVVLTMLLAVASVVFAQKTGKTASERSVSGVVTDGGGAPIPGAVVQLKNTKNLQVRSFIAREKGDYYFHGLSTDVDYELKAESNGKSGPAKTLSSFDSKTEATINLQVK